MVERGRVGRVFQPPIVSSMIPPILYQIVVKTQLQKQLQYANMQIWTCNGKPLQAMDTSHVILVKIYSICLYVSILAELVILRSNVQQFVMAPGEYLNGVNTLSSPFYFLGREKIKKLTLNKLYLMKFILEDNDGKHTIKFENWQLKPNNVVWFKNCISRDLGKLL